MMSRSCKSFYYGAAAYKLRPNGLAPEADQVWTALAAGLRRGKRRDLLIKLLRLVADWF